MKGVIFNVVESFVIENFGDDVWDEVLDNCELKTQEPFVGPGTYPDEDLIEIATKTVERVEVPLPDALRAIGKYGFPKLAAMVPQLVSSHEHPKPFLLSVHDVIHVEVRKLHETAETPDFRYAQDAPDHLAIEYHSRRGLCHLMAGLLDGVEDHFGVPFEQVQSACVHDGAAHCRFELRFSAASRAGGSSD